MSDPIGLRRALDFRDRHSKYIEDDLSKQHLAKLMSDDSDFIIFDFLSDIRCPLIRSGSTFFFDPNGMHNSVPDARPSNERWVDIAALIGTNDFEPFQFGSQDFFETWRTHFDRFYHVVLKSFLDRGCGVINQQVYYAHRPGSPMTTAEIGYRDVFNAMLRRMHAYVASFPGVSRIRVDERLCLTGADAPFGGPDYVHPIREVFALLADQARLIMSDDVCTKTSPTDLADIHSRFGRFPRDSAFRRFRRNFGRKGALVIRSDLIGFDPKYYLHWYKDVVSFGGGPVEHYLQLGWREGRDPSAGFSTSGYLTANPDVAASGVCPLLHFLEKGLVEGRSGWRKRNPFAPPPSPRIGFA